MTLNNFIRYPLPVRCVIIRYFAGYSKPASSLFMRKAWALALFSTAVTVTCRAQCPTAPLAIQGGHCTGDTLRIAGAATSAQIDWYLNGRLYKTVSAVYQPAPAVIVAGGNGLGSRATELHDPNQIYLDDKDTLYVSDAANFRAQQFPPRSTGATPGITVVQEPLGTPGGSFTGVYGDGNGNIFTEEAEAIYKWPRGAGAGAGTVVATVTPYGPNRLADPAEICVDAADNVYVVEPAGNRVMKWAPGAASGIIVAGGNGPGAGAAQLNYPFAVFVDKAGAIYITDFNNSRVQKWVSGAASGTTVAGGNGQGSAANQLNAPMAVYVDAAGNVYVADAFNNRVQWWPPGATAGITVAGGNGPGSALNQLSEPTGVFVAADGYLYTSDHYNYRVVKNLPQPVATIDTTLVLTLPGVYTATITGPDGCVISTTPLTVLASAAVRVHLAAQPDPVCSADSVLLSATADTIALPSSVWQWTINNTVITDSGATYLYRQPVTGATVNCRLDVADVCVSGASDTLALQVKVSPAIAPGQVFPLPYGGSITLTPQVSGDVSTYAWSPSAALSDTTSPTPLASPRSTVTYLLRVTGTDGCTVTAPIKVDVYIPLRIPGAFTPNGDGRNDVFYVLGGPPGLVIREMAVFDRVGQRVFQARNIAPGDPAAGWTGRNGGQPMQAGTFVYFLSVQLPDGTSTTVKGTVELIR